MQKLLRLFKFLTAGVILISMVFAAYRINNRIKNEAMGENIILTSFRSSKPVFNNINLSKNDTPQKGYAIIDNINLFIEEKSVSSKDIILCKNNRYYFKISVFEKILGYSIRITDEGFYVIDDNHQVQNHFIQPLLTHDDTPYLSMIDLTEGLGLTFSWNYDSKTLNFYKLRNKLSHENRKQYKKPSLIRFEDITAGMSYKSSDNLYKMRIISDFMYSKSLPFHIAWIPRYRNPKLDIDNDLLKVYSLSNVDFIYTMDYMIAKGGIVGLHGYTHQYGDEESAIGSEFGYNSYYTREYTKNRVEASINTAKELSIPFKFFESPHYTSSKEQQAIFENYFDYIFEPEKYLFNTIPVISKGNNRTIYVPTPLGYVHKNTAEDIIERIKTKPKDYIASFFYHPYLEFDYIKLKNKDSYPDYEYSDKSILKEIIKCLDSEGFTPVKITDITIS
jgi:hypothetical protein